MALPIARQGHDQAVPAVPVPRRHGRIERLRRCPAQRQMTAAGVEGQCLGALAPAQMRPRLPLPFQLGPAHLGELRSSPRQERPQPACGNRGQLRVVSQRHHGRAGADSAGECRPSAGVHLARLIQGDDIGRAEPKAIVLDPPDEGVEGQRLDPTSQVGGQPLGLGSAHRDREDPPMLTTPHVGGHAEHDALADAGFPGQGRKRAAEDPIKSLTLLVGQPNRTSQQGLLDIRGPGRGFLRRRWARVVCYCPRKVATAASTRLGLRRCSTRGRAARAGESPASSRRRGSPRPPRPRGEGRPRPAPRRQVG